MVNKPIEAEKEEASELSLLPQEAALETTTAKKPRKQVSNYASATQRHREQSLSPKYLLNSWYRVDSCSDGRLPTFEKSVHVEKVEGNKNQGWHTASVTCPITGVTLEAGTLRDPGNSSIKVIDGKPHYEKSKRGGPAIQAAAARLLDSIRYTLSKEKEPRLCVEEPILLSEELLTTPRPRMRGVLKCLEHAFRPLQIDRTAVDNALKSMKLGDKWTATFTCPLTGYTTQSGTLVGSRKHDIVDDTSVVYGTMWGSRVSAAARFLDDLRYTQTGEAEPRWCEEVPSLIEIQGIEKLFFDSESEKTYLENLEMKLAEAQAAKEKAAPLGLISRERSPKGTLNNEYQKLGMSGPIVKNATTLEKTEHGWIATFTCPVTGHTATSGTCRQRNDVKVVDGVAYYDNEGAAEHMAAARFLDDMTYAKTGAKEPRLCDEEPALFPIERFAAPVKEATSSDVGTPQRTSAINELNNMYQKLGVQRGVRKGMAVAKSIEGSTSTFTCPVTGHVVESGTLRDKPAVHAIDGKVFYERERESEQAAASRFLDDLSFTQTGEVESRRCEEIPSAIDNLAETWIKEKARETKRGHDEKLSPKSLLSSLYDRLQRSSSNKGVVRKGMNAEKIDGVWTASFTCPITGHTVKSGQWKEAPGSYQVVDEQVFYDERKKAEQAAAARFLDDVQYSESGETEPRLCQEMPLSLPIEALKATRQKIGDTPITPRAQLDREYQVLGNRKSLKDQYAVKKMGSWCTASFTCPMTGYKVESGTLAGKKTKVVDGVVVYKQRNDAMHAAAARFLDNLRYTMTGEEGTRLCEELPTAFEDPEKLFKFYAGPRRMLKNVYISCSEQATVESINVGLGEWTGTFVCPVTGYVAYAGFLRGSKSAIRGIDGTVVYDSHFEAEVAVAARFLDDLRFTQTGEAEPRWCEEAPSLIQAEGIEQLFLDTEVEKQYAAAVEKRVQIYADRAAGFRLLPSMVLKNALRKVQIDPETRSAAFESRLLGENEWTGSYTCPITGHTEKAGTLRGSADARIVGSDVIYNNIGGSRVAAAGRFLDNLWYTQTGETNPRWCEEYPSLIEADGIEKLFFDAGDQKRYHDTLTKRSGEGPVTDKQNNDDDDEELVLVQPLSSTAKASEDTTSSKEITKPESSTALSTISQWEQQSEDGDEELVLQNVSSFGFSGTSALDRIMEAWGETVVTHKTVSEGKKDVSTRGAVQMSPSQQKAKVINDTIAWYNRLSKQSDSINRGYRVFQTTTSMTAKSASAALRALSKAHWSYPSEDRETDERAEAAAQQMLDLMWTTGTPSIDGYNSYLRCLARSSAAERGKEAEVKLRAMIERKEVDGRLLPEPNTDTFNTVIQLWALAGGDEGYSKGEEIFELFEEAKNQGLDVQPNRDTFLSVLSSLARPKSAEEASSFDRGRAKRWIEQMTQLGEQSGDTALTADTQVFNAPLRWTGGADASRTRPFTQSLRWDNHCDIFQNGFRPLQENDPLWVEARRTEEWLLEMETIGPDPDAESFEAAIQAWTRTGMEDGLRRAELVAFRALASDKILPRLQTFHPIIAAWAYSGDDRGLGKVEEWAEQLSGVAMDERIDLAKMIARRAMQKRLLLDDAGSDSIDRATELAKSCAEELKELVESSKDGESMLDPTIFSHAASAWGNVALAKKDTALTDDALAKDVESMMEVVKQFDGTIQHFRLENQKDDDDDSAPKNTTQSDLQQLQRLLQYSQTVYLNVLSTLNELDRQRNVQGTQVEEQSAFYRHLFAAESMLRRAQELRQVLYSQLSNDDVSPDDVGMHYNDYYTYPAKVSDAFEDRSFLEKQIALYSEVIEGCKRLQSSDCLGDSLRLAMLVVDFMEQSSSSYQLSHQKPVDCTDLYLGILEVVDAVSNDSEKHALLRRVFYSVNGLWEREGDGDSPFSVDKNAVMAAIKTDSVEAGSNKKKSTTRSRRRRKRQQWRTASHAWN